MIHYDLNGCSVAVERSEILAEMQRFIQTKHSFLPVTTLNVTMFSEYNRMDTLFNWLKKQALFTPDGVSISIMIFMRYFRWVNRYPGIEMVHDLLSEFDGLRVAFIGARQDRLNLASDYFTLSFPQHSLVFSLDGFTEFTDDHIHHLSQVKPDVILIALGCPKQDELLMRLSNTLPFGIGIGVGGVFDVWSGATRRAPKFFRSIGLEWLYRMIQMPRRIPKVFSSFIYLFK